MIEILNVRALESGYLVNGLYAVDVLHESYNDVLKWVSDGKEVMPLVTNAELQAEYIARLVQHFTDVTTKYIEDKVQAYNTANGLAFTDIDAFTKYAINPQSVHNTIANQFIVYADKVWKAARTYQSTATTIPTDAEFKAILDGVVF